MSHLTKGAPERHPGARFSRIPLRLARRTHLLAVALIYLVPLTPAAAQESADQRDLRLACAALSLMAPENMRFRVIASNDDGVWNEAGAAVALAVAPHFYETRMYYLLLTGTLVLLVFVGVRWRIRGLRARERELSALVDARTEQMRHHEAQLEAQNAMLQAQAEKLAELDRAKSRFFANVSHEFRTPLTLTIGPLEDLRSGLHGELEPEPSRQLEMALRNARRLLRLVNQLLDAAKLEAGQMKLRARELDLVAFLRGLVDAFALLADRRRVTVRFAGPSAGLLVWFDSSAMEKVFTNLLSNAFKFTPEGGTVSVEMEGATAEADDGQVLVRVVNSGAGIPERELPHVFERFFQVDESHTRLQVGTGIGLSLAKEYIELHGGDIRVESSMGTGTTFTVSLPLGRRHLRDDEIVEEVSRPTPAAAFDPPAEALPEQAESRAALAALEAADLAPSDGDGEGRALEDGPMEESTAAAAGDSQDVTTVLVVDDHADVRAYIRGHLESTYRVAEAANGVEGVALARTLLPDLVISDVMMPDTDGYALCRALRSSPETDFIPVILLTAKASTESKIAGLEEGADDYVVKPFHVEELEARVANLIDSRRRLRERFAGKRIELHARDVTVTSSDVSYLEGVRRVIEAHLSDETFTVTQLADRVGQDRSHFYRRIKSLLGETPTDLIRRLRLERAAALLGGQAGTVAEVAYAVGFKGVSYFCKCFRDAYGVTPSTYRSNPPQEIEPPIRSGDIR
jgi:signal transduction histidine kinase/DNA-binding response OmpR family regulator